MFKRVLMTGIFLGSLVGTSGTVQAGAAGGQADRVEQNALVTNRYEKGDRVWVWATTGPGTRAKMYGWVVNTAYGGTSVCIKFDNIARYDWCDSDLVYPG